MKKRIVAMLLTAALLVSGLDGCGNQEEPLPSTVPATGRYVESEISLPAQGYPMDMVRLSGGQLRIGLLTADQKCRIFTRDSSDNWTEDVTLPDSLSGYGAVDQLKLSPDGSVFLSAVQDRGGETYSYHFLVCSSGGELREVPITYPQVNEKDGFLLSNADFTDSGKLMALFAFDDLREVNLSDGKGIVVGSVKG